MPSIPPSPWPGETRTLWQQRSGGRRRWGGCGFRREGGGGYAPPAGEGRWQPQGVCRPGKGESDVWRCGWPFPTEWLAGGACAAAATPGTV
eukprot:scaffold14033_cov90-Isochrysis_galbana.AAC.1